MRFIDIIYWLSLIGADFFVFIILALLLMAYEGNYDGSKGEIMEFGEYEYSRENSFHLLHNMDGLKYYRTYLHRLQDF
jgi:hypothetical protein